MSLVYSNLKCVSSVLAKIGSVLASVLVSVLADFLKSLQGTDNKSFIVC